MVNQYDLYDITYALSIIRNDIQGKLNKDILSMIILVLNNKQCLDDNQIRKSLAQIEGLDKERFYYVYHNNVYVDHRILKDEAIYTLLIKLYQEIITALDNNHFERAFDIIDYFHCLTSIIADNNFSIPKKFWKTYANQYRKKWNKTFLMSEQKKLKHNFMK